MKKNTDPRSGTDPVPENEHGQFFSRSTRPDETTLSSVPSTGSARGTSESPSRPPPPPAAATTAALLTFNDKEIQSPSTAHVPGAHQHQPPLDTDEVDGKNTGGGISAVKEAIKARSKARKDQQSAPAVTEDKDVDGISTVKEAILSRSRDRKGERAAPGMTDAAAKDTTRAYSGTSDGEEVGLTEDKDVDDVSAVKEAILSRSRDRKGERAAPGVTDNLDADNILDAKATIRARSKTRDSEQTGGVTEETDADDILAVKEAIISRSRDRNGARAATSEANSESIGGTAVGRGDAMRGLLRVGDQNHSGASPTIQDSTRNILSLNQDDESVPKIVPSAESTGDADPSLINAVLVESGLVFEAEPIVAENHFRRWLIVALIVTAALVIGLAAGICGDGSCGAAPPSSSVPTSAPASPPSPELTPVIPSCFLDFSSTRCNIGSDFIVGGLPCEEYRHPEIGGVESCLYPPIAVEFLFNGGDCSQSDNARQLNFNCTDFNSGPPINSDEEVYIVATDHNDTSGEEEILFDGIVAVGDIYTIATSNGTIFRDTQHIVISSVLDRKVILQTVNFSLSCRTGLELANRYGASQVVSFYNNEQGLVSAIQDSIDFAVPIEIAVTIIPTDLEESVLITNLTADPNFADWMYLTDLVPDVIDVANPAFFILAGTVDSLVQRIYTLEYHYVGYSNAMNSTCGGTQSAAFVFGMPYNV